MFATRTTEEGGGWRRSCKPVVVDPSCMHMRMWKTGKSLECQRLSFVRSACHERDTKQAWTRAEIGKGNKCYDPIVKKEKKTRGVQQHKLDVIQPANRQPTNQPTNQFEKNKIVISLESIIDATVIDIISGSRPWAGLINFHSTLTF